MCDIRAWAPQNSKQAVATAAGSQENASMPVRADEWHTKNTILAQFTTVRFLC